MDTILSLNISIIIFCVSDDIHSHLVYGVFVKRRYLTHDESLLPCPILYDMEVLHLILRKKRVVFVSCFSCFSFRGNRV
jgi:hypothetical protein